MELRRADENEGLTQTGGRISARRQRLYPGPTVRAGFNFRRSGLRNANTNVPVKMVFSASGAIALTSVFVALAGEFIATANAVAVAGFGSGLNGYEGHKVCSPQKIT